MAATKRGVIVCLLVLLFAGIIGGPTLLAQSDNAGVVGTVKDASSAAVPDATIKVTNIETAQSFDTKTGLDGSYTVPSILHPGNYQVTASKQGFKTSTSDPMTLEVGDIKQVDLILQLGSAKETVTVSGSTVENLETQTSDRGAVITGSQIIDLPLNGQNFTELAVLQPGVTHAYVNTMTTQAAFNGGNPNAGSVPGGGDPHGSTPGSRFQSSDGAEISVNGQRPSNNDYTLDGVDNNEPEFGSIGVFPNPEAIQEFKIDTSMAKAEYGRGGAVINTLYKSGTNNFHGELYYFGQNEDLNATHWVLNKEGMPKAIDRTNEYGGTIGGPVILPHYNGKDKTFFFFDYLGQDNNTPYPFQSSVPTPLSRTGNFSQFTQQVIDPMTCPVDAAIPDWQPGASVPLVSTPGPGTTCQYFPGNVIPNLQNRPDFSKQGFAILNAYPMPNATVPTNPGQGDSNFDYFGTRVNPENINSYDVKIDQKISDKDHISGRFTFDNQNVLRGNFFPGLPTAGFGAGSEIGNTRQVVVTETHIFTPTILNEAKFGWTRVDIGILNCGVEGACGGPPDFCTKLGIPNCNKGTPATTGSLLTGIANSGFLEFLGDGGLYDNRSNNFYASDDVTIIHGKHTVKFGGAARPTQLAVISSNYDLKGQLNYYGGFDDLGNGQADWLLGIGASAANSGTYEGGDIPVHLRDTEWGLFVQDDWKATPALTLNLGVRWDLYPPFTERDARLANYDVTTDTILPAKNSSDALVNSAYHNVGPRVGFAYNFGPQKQFVLRGGYGIFYTQDAIDVPPLAGNPPIVSQVGYTFSATGPGAIVSNFTTGPPVAPVQNPPVITPNSVLYTEAPNQLVGQIQEWNLDAQYQFAKSYLFDVAYVGSVSHHLLATRNLGSNFNGLGQAVAPSTSCSTPPCYIGSDELYDNRANAVYDGLQVSLRKNFSKGLQFLTSYTWSHALDDTTGVFNGVGESNGASNGPTDPLDFNLDRGNSSLDHRNVFVASGIWSLPFGHGQAWGGNVTGAADKVISGWQLNFVQTLQSGQHFDVVINTNIGALRPDIIGNPFAGTTIDDYLNEAAFTAPALLVKNLAGGSIPVGDLSRNYFTGPALYDTDLSLFKTTSITERVRLRFELEAFNVWNSVNRIVPNNNASPGSGLGVFNNAFPPRTVQYALKLMF